MESFRERELRTQTANDEICEIQDSQMALTKNDTDGEVILAEARQSANQRVERALSVDMG
jgi:hypothetical protein